MRPQVEAWDHGYRTLGKISERHPNLAYDGLGMLLQLEWQYLKRTFPIVGTLMSPIKGYLRETPPPRYSGGGRLTPTYRKS